MKRAHQLIHCTLFFLITFLGLLADSDKKDDMSPDLDDNTQSPHEFALIGGGCFWCTEAVFEKLDGVLEVISGYAGGDLKNPTYKDICTGTSGHAEVIRIKFLPEIISFSKILQTFGAAHDPTTLNRQGADVGTQYRSTIMFYNEEQQKIAQLWKAKLTEKFEDPVVTEIVPVPKFYPAEDYHQDYYAKNPNQGYCSFVIRPKLKKLGLE